MSMDYPCESTTNSSEDNRIHTSEARKVRHKCRSVALDNRPAPGDGTCARPAEAAVRAVTTLALHGGAE